MKVKFASGFVALGLFNLKKYFLANVISVAGTIDGGVFGIQDRSFTSTGGNSINNFSPLPSASCSLHDCSHLQGAHLPFSSSCRQ